MLSSVNYCIYYVIWEGTYVFFFQQHDIDLWGTGYETRNNFDLWGTGYGTRKNFHYHIIDVHDEPAMALTNGLFLKQTKIHELEIYIKKNFDIEIVV